MQNSATKIIKFILNKKNVEKLYKKLSKQTVIPLILLSVLFIFSKLVDGQKPFLIAEDIFDEEILFI